MLFSCDPCVELTGVYSSRLVIHDVAGALLGLVPWESEAVLDFREVITFSPGL